MAQRIKDRGIKWREIYRDKSATLKKRYEDEIGRNSYFRWEGYDSISKATYYVICGPGYSKEKGKMFFTGIRKMPADYSPSGKYFPTMQAAAKYAKENWGVPAMIMPSYTQRDLANVKLSGEGKEKPEDPKADAKIQKAWDRVLHPNNQQGAQ